MDTPVSKTPPKDKFSALWISHSSLSDFLACPRLYYLSNIYKNPRTGRKIGIIKAPLVLGSLVHSILESLSQLPTEERFNQDLKARFTAMWKNYEGRKGGFKNKEEEDGYFKRGERMLERIIDHPGPLARKALKTKEDLPFYWFSEEDNIILCGKIDWIEYLEETDSVHIIDFKTGRKKENGDSLQLPIYHLLATHCQSRPVSKMSYWYLEADDEPSEVPMRDSTTAEKNIMDIAKRMKLAKQLNHFKCSKETSEGQGCLHCAPLEAIVKGKGEFIGVGEYNKEMYILPDSAVSL